MNVLPPDGKIVTGMALMRFLSASIEALAAVLMLRLNSVEKAFQINAVLALIGPLIMIIVATLGVIGLAGKIPVHKIAMIGLGVSLILLATR